MAETNPIKYSDLVQPDESIEKLINQLGTLLILYNNLHDTVLKDSKEMANALKAFSGATAEGRKKIAETSTEAEKLARAQKSLQDAQSETAKQIEILNALRAQQVRANKEDAKAVLAQSGSYNDLSAQYSKLTRELHNMNPVTEEGRKIFDKKQQAARELREQMNKLQKQVGNFTLQVGNYNIVGESMRNVIAQGKNALAEMEQQGKQTSAEYQELANKLSKMQDQFEDTNAMIKNMASDTAGLDAALQALAVGTGGFAAVTGAMELFGGESKEVEEAQKKLQAAIALVNGVTAIQNALQKQSSLMTTLRRMALKGLSKETTENTAVTAANTAGMTANAAATKTANEATLTFGKTLKGLMKNPVFLAIAGLVITLTTVAGVIKHIRGAQKELYEEQLRLLKVTEAQLAVNKLSSDKALADAKQRIKEAQAQGKSEKEILDLREEQLAIEAEQSMQANIMHRNEINNLDENKKKLAENTEALRKNELEGKQRVKLKKYQVEEIEAENALLEEQIKIAEEQMAKDDELRVSALELAEARRQNAIATAKAEEDSLRSLQDARIKLIRNGYARQRAEINASYDRQIADIETALKNELNLTATEQKNMNALIVELRKQRKMELAEVNKQQLSAERETVKATQNMLLNLMRDGADKEQAQLLANYQAQANTIRDQLKEGSKLTLTERIELNKQLLLLQAQYQQESNKLTKDWQTNQLNAELKGIELRKAALKGREKQSVDDMMREIDIREELEIKANAELAKEVQQSETAIRAKYAAQRMKAQDEMMKEVAMEQLDIQQKLAESGIDLMKGNEKKKTAARLQLERERLLKILELNEKANIKMSEEERKTIENQIKKIEQDLEKNRKPTTIWEMLGIDMSDEQREALNESLEYAKSVVSDFLDYKMQVSQQAVDAANREVEATQNVLNSEREARAAGYANNVAMAEKELAQAKAQQRKALKQQQETQRQQQKLQTVEQAVNLVTGTAKIIGQFGMPWAIPMIALMWASFAASKIKSRQLANEQYGEGTVELLEGGSHQSGNDIDLGVKKDGRRRRAEGGEFFAVINKRQSRKYRKEIPDIINSLNRGDFAEKYTKAYDGGMAVIAHFDGKAELTSIAKNIGEMNERSKQTNVVYTIDGRVEKRGNVTRIIKN